MQKWTNRSYLIMVLCLLLLLAACSAPSQREAGPTLPPAGVEQEQQETESDDEEPAINLFAFEPVKTTLDIGGGGWWGIEIQDMDGDGSLELVAANNPEGVLRIYSSDDLSTFQPDKALAVDAGPSGLELAGFAVADFDGDGMPDIAISHFEGDRVSFLFNDGSGDFVAGSAISVGEEPSLLRAVDLELDGDMDLILTHLLLSEINLLRNDGTGTFSADEPIQMMPGGEIFAEVGDLNNDTYPDVIVAHRYDTRISTLLNDSGLLGEPKEYVIESSPQGVAIGDLDDNGAADLVVIGTSGTISVLVNDGTGALVAREKIDAGGTLKSALLADMSGDGLLDLLVASDGGYNVRAFVNSGDGAFAHHADYAAFPTAPRHLDLADIDGDGMDELIATGFSKVALFDFAD